MFLIKIGGSVITDKNELYNFKDDVTRRLIGEIKDSAVDFVLVHGAGSYGHIIANKHRLQDGFNKDEQLLGFSRVHRDVRELNLKILDILGESGMNPISLAPNNILSCENKRIKDIDPSIFMRSTELSLIPVTFGDVVFDSKLGFCICSGDDLMLELSKIYHPEKAIFITDVDGIFDRNPRLHYDAKLLEHIDKGLVKGIRNHRLECTTCGKGSEMDATGGIMRKLDIMLKISEIGVDTTLLNGLHQSRLKDCLSGEKVIGTVVKGIK